MRFTLIVSVVNRAILRTKLCRQTPDLPLQVAGFHLDEAPDCVSPESPGSNQKSAMSQPLMMRRAEVALPDLAQEARPPPGLCAFFIVQTASRSFVAVPRWLDIRGRAVDLSKRADEIAVVQAARHCVSCFGH